MMVSIAPIRTSVPQVIMIVLLTPFVPTKRIMLVNMLVTATKDTGSVR